MSAVSDDSPPGPGPGPGPNPASASAPALGAALPAMVEAPSISTALIKKRKSGYLVEDPNELLTPDGFKRQDFVGVEMSTVDDITTQSERLFYLNRVFNSKQHLFDALNHFGKGYFSACFHGKSLECQKGHKHEKKKKEESSDDEEDMDIALPPTAKKTRGHGKRGEGKSSLKVGCSFKINFQPIDQNEKNGQVKITSASHKHDLCEPCNPETYPVIMKKSHSSFHDISHGTKVFLAYLLYRNPTTDSRTIRNLAEQSLPKGIMLNASQICNLRSRLKNFIPSDQGILDIDSFQSRMNVDDNKIWDGLNLFSHIADGEVSTIVDDVYLQLQGSSVQEHSFLLEEFFSRCALRDPSFTYDLWLNREEQRFIGAAWMTSHMRSNCELFGSFITIDMMKRELNEFNWPYVAVTGKNEFGKICVLLEGIVLEETEDAYKWFLQKLFHMCPNRLPSEYYVVSGDGFFSQEMIVKLGFSQANYLYDNWHLRRSIENQFGHRYAKVGSLNNHVFVH